MVEPIDRRPPKAAAAEPDAEPQEPVGFNPDEEAADAAYNEMLRLAARFNELLVQHEVDPRSAAISRTNLETAVLWARVALIE